MYLLLCYYSQPKFTKMESLKTGLLYLTRENLGNVYKDVKMLEISCEMFNNIRTEFENAAAVIFTDNNGQQKVLKNRNLKIATIAEKAVILVENALDEQTTEVCAIVDGLRLNVNVIKSGEHLTLDDLKRRSVYYQTEFLLTELQKIKNKTDFDAWLFLNWQLFTYLETGAITYATNHLLKICK